VLASSITLGLGHLEEKVDVADQDHTNVLIPIAGAVAKVS